MTVKDNGRKLSGKEQGQVYSEKFNQWWEGVKSNPASIEEVTHNYGKETVTLNKSALGRIFKCDRKKFDTNSQIVEKIREIETELRSLVVETLAETTANDDPEQTEITSTASRPVPRRDDTEPVPEESTNAIVEHYKSEVARLNSELRKAQQREITLQVQLDKANGLFKRHKLVHSALTDMGVILDGKA